MGQITISMAIFNSFLYVYQRVREYLHKSGLENDSFLRFFHQDVLEPPFADLVSVGPATDFRGLQGPRVDPKDPDLMNIGIHIIWG